MGIVDQLSTVVQNNPFPSPIRTGACAGKSKYFLLLNSFKRLNLSGAMARASSFFVKLFSFWNLFFFSYQYFCRCNFGMTSETTIKSPKIIKPNCGKKESWIGFIVIIITWIYLYFNVVTTLFDGVLAFMGHEIMNHALIELTNIGVTVISASSDTVEFGSSKYYALCGLGGVLSCGITHTAIVPLDLVKCRIQV